MSSRRACHFRLFCFSLLVCGLQTAVVAQTGSNSPPTTPQNIEDQALEALTAPFLQDCLQTADQLKKWRADYDNVKKTLNNDPNAGAAGTPLNDWVQGVDGFLQNRSPQFIAILQYNDNVAKIKARHGNDDQPACTRELAAYYSGGLFTTMDSLSNVAKKA